MTSEPHDDIIILFTRYPVAGRCKTRLIPALGPEGAAALHREMTHRILAQLTALAAVVPYRLEIHHDGGDSVRMRSWLGATPHYRQQERGDIGCRMRAAINSHVGRMRRLLLIGSDCPALSAAILLEAFAALNSHDLTLGPAADGGYYLIGLRAEASALACNTLFQDIAWGTETVFATTQTRAARYQLRCHTLITLHDIDTPEDLVYLHHHSNLE